MILENGKPLLIDFGAARRVIGDVTQALTVMGFARYATLPRQHVDGAIFVKFFVGY
jgi:hypothetical protein